MIKERKVIRKNNRTGNRGLFFIAGLLLVGAGVLCFRLRGGVQVKAPRDREYLPEKEVALYRQDDERWGEDRLGDSKYTMRSSGCLVSCIASALSMESGMEETPGVLNKKFSEEQVYDGEGNLQWGLLSEGGEYQADVYGEVSSEVIETCLLQGHYPIARVRMYALGNFHYVLIVGLRDGEYLCMDPLRDGITELSDYGSRVYAVRCVYYGDRSSQKEEDDENAESMDNVKSMENTEDMEIFMAENLPETDLNRNGIPEELRIMEAEHGDGERLEVLENGEKILWEEGYYIHEGQKAMFLCRRNGEDYLLRYQPAMYQGCGDYSYELFSMEDGGETTVQWDAVSFDINFGSPVHGDFDAEAIASFMEDINDLLSHSILLINTDSELQETFEREAKLEDTLWWLEGEESGFHRDPSRSLLENLQDFQNVMAQVEPSPRQSCESLPFEQPMEMIFCSGAGAWRTTLTLNPDGSFTGDYSDSDMGVMGEEYPNGTRYVCRFHGSFGEIERVSGASFSMILTELVLDTEHPVGEEWIEDGVRLVSSGPYGLDGEDGDALKPGAVFFFYTPEATGHEPGTELYGALQFWYWWPERREFVDENDKLGRYGLYNLETGHGFFSEPMAD